MIKQLFKSKKIAIIDSTFPQKEPRGFRNSEINQYLKKIKNITVFTMPPMKNQGSWFSHGYGIEKEEFNDNLKSYLNVYPENKKKIHYLDKKYIKSIGLAYSFFLAETYTLLPYYEKNKIPFVFVLYPGGGFGLNFKDSDRMLTEIFSSTYFRGVIVTQPITKEYILKKKLCAKDKVKYIYGGFVQFSKKDVFRKKRYKQDKNTFDICFVAKKYSERGEDKGYDLFIETAEKICKQSNDIYFHVVGNFQEYDIDISNIPKNRIKFYGLQRPEFLRSFYAKMDIYLSPNRKSILFPGNFDGFPLGGDASYCGVARFVSNPLNIKTKFRNRKEIVIVKPNVEDIVSKIMDYYSHPKKLYKLSVEGQKMAQKLFDRNYQIQQRINFFEEYVEVIKYNN